ncbi:MAG: acetyl-CoA C-acetyltransferase [Acidobacteria bacterium]|nr:acetyl-CoA C-acetyltransferase [Acidobacteriota bacterium]MDW7983510.1 acetyl-CoA C-acetyltransferase [Acidobacteriota bacterium]
MGHPVAILSAARTPIGSFGGVFLPLTAVELGVWAARAAIERAGLEPSDVELTVMGIARQAGCGPNPARQVAYRCGVPVDRPAFTINMACASSLQALISGMHAIQMGDARVVLVGGMESMSRVPYLLDRARFEGYRLGDGVLIDGNYRDGFLDPLSGLLMGQTAENLVRRYRISREGQDAYALRSHRRAVWATQTGRFRDEIVPVSVPQRRGEPALIDWDEHPRADTSLEKLAQLPPVFQENGTVTAGNSSGIADGAAALLLTRADLAGRLGRRPLAIVEAYTVVGVAPEIMGIGPVPAVRRLLEKTGLPLEAFELIECNEAFAAQVLAVERELQWDPDIVNVNGGAIALGHPIGATGARIVTTLVHEMQKRHVRRGLATLCASGGLGVAVSLVRP